MNPQAQQQNKNAARSPLLAVKRLTRTFTQIDFIAAAALSLMVVWMVMRVIGRDSNGNWFAHWYGVWGDWNVHLAFTNAFLERGLFWWLQDHPSALNEGFRYPWASHALQALITLPFRWFGNSNAEATLYCFWFLSASLLGSLPFFVRKIFRFLGLNKFEITLGLLLFFFFGGFGFLERDSGSLLFTNNPKAGIEFTHFLTSEWIPQRSFLFALLQGIAAFFLYSRNSEKSKTTALILIGLLPITHVHSWISVSFLTGILLLKEKRFKKIAILCAASAVGLALLFHGTKSFSKPWDLWNPGWLQKENAIWFWLTNTGILIPWAVLSLVRGVRNLIWWIGLCGAGLFTLATFINFQAHVYDNLKIYTYAVLFLIPLLVRSENWKGCPRWLNIALAVSLVLAHSVSGFNDSIQMINRIQTAPWFTQKQIQSADAWMKQRSTEQKNWRALTAPSHYHWLPVLTAQPVVMHYAGWLWTWGINHRPLEVYWERVKKSDRRLFRDLRKNKIQILAIDAGQFFYDQMPASILFTDEAGTLYDLTTSSDSDLDLFEKSVP